MSEIVTDWSAYPDFSESEFRCKYTGKCEMRKDFMDKLQELRTAYGKPIHINSGYRHWSHPEELVKGHRNGEHVQGRCCDVRVTNPDAFRLMALAISIGFTRVGVSQRRDAPRFMHLGMGGGGLPEPAVWSYK